MKLKVLDPLRFCASFLKRNPFDTSTPGGRSLERYRRAVLTTLSSGVARGFSLLAMFISVPLALRYLGSEQYALWMTITSIIGMLTFADLGLGNGLLNVISESHGKEDQDAALKYVSSAFVMLSCIAVLTTIAFLVAYPYLPWKQLFNLSLPLAIHEAGPATAAFVACFILSLPLGIVQRVQLGYQQGYINNLWGGIGSIFGLLALLLGIHLRLGLHWLVLAIAGVPVLMLMLNGLFLFGIERPWLRPRLHAFSLQTAKRLLGIGLAFFVIQASMAAGYQSDNLILAQILGPESVTVYAVAYKLFSVAPAVLTILTMPLWPAYGEALARQDLGWIKKTLRRTLLLGLALMIPANLSLIILGQHLVHLWVGFQVTPPIVLLVGLGLWGILNGLLLPLGMFLNGLNAIRFAALCHCFMCAVSIVLGIWLTRLIGISGVIFGMFAAQIVCLLIPNMVYAVLLLARLERGSSQQLTLPLPDSLSINFVSSYDGTD
jgi:O-antigen/teichoic acid export membrane protein